MKKIALIIILSFSFNLLIGQDSRPNLDKYWFYRHRLREQFMVVSPNISSFGYNLPASLRALSADGTIKSVHWDDNNANLPHYLGVLATEYRLLKDNNQNYSETLKELLYVMHAIERRDAYSEYILRVVLNKPITYQVDGVTVKVYSVMDDLNGFYIRDDVTDGFWMNNYSHFGFSNFDIDNQLYSNGYARNDAVFPYESMSMDNVIHLLEGLALISKLVGTENVINIPINIPEDYFIMDYLISKGIYTGTSVNFSKWAKDITARSIRVMQNEGTISWTIGNFLGVSETHWFLYNYIRKSLVEEGDGTDDFGMRLLNWAICEAGTEITGEDFHFDGSIYNDHLYLNSFTFLCDGIWEGLIDAYKTNTLGMLSDACKEQFYDDGTPYKKSNYSVIKIGQI
jgi:hypothetical protein